MTRKEITVSKRQLINLSGPHVWCDRMREWRDEEKGKEEGVYMSIHKVTHYTDTRMGLNSSEVMLRILCVIQFEARYSAHW